MVSCTRLSALWGLDTRSATKRAKRASSCENKNNPASNVVSSAAAAPEAPIVPAAHAAKRFLSCRRRRYFKRQWGASGVIGRFHNGRFNVII